MSEGGGVSLLELLDSIIERVNSLRSMFFILILGSMILSPAAIILSLIVIFHPLILFLLMKQQPFLAWILFSASIGTMLLSLITLYFSLKEYRFFTKWGKRYKEYLMKKEKLEEELKKEGLV